MKPKIFILTLALALLPSLALAYEATFLWSPNMEPDILGYRLWQSNTSGGYDFQGLPIADAVHEQGCIDANSDGIVDTCAVTLANIPDGTHFWVLTAYDLEGYESGASNEVNYTHYDGATGTPPAPPVLLEFRPSGN